MIFILTYILDTFDKIFKRLFEKDLPCVEKLCRRNLMDAAGCAAAGGFRVSAGIFARRISVYPNFFSGIEFDREKHIPCQVKVLS